jgi:hypothetical protein
MDWNRASLHIIGDGQGVMREGVFAQMVQREGRVGGVAIAREGESGIHSVINSLLEKDGCMPTPGYGVKARLEVQGDGIRVPCKVLLLTRGTFWRGRGKFVGDGNRECGTASGRESVGRDQKGQAYCTAVVIDTCIDIARAKNKVTVLLARRPSDPLF